MVCFAARAPEAVGGPETFVGQTFQLPSLVRVRFAAPVASRVSPELRHELLPTTAPERGARPNPNETVRVVPLPIVVFPEVCR